MTKINLDALSLAELKSLQKDMEKAIERAEKRERKEALDKLETEAKKLGFTLAELLSIKDGKPPGQRSKAAPKYKHPDDPSVTWTGRGRQPKWIKDGLAEGKSLDDFLI